MTSVSTKLYGVISQVDVLLKITVAKTSNITRRFCASFICTTVSHGLNSAENFVEISSVL